MKVKELYDLALEKKYAIGAFNFANIETLKAIIQASQKSNKPVLACVSEGAMKYLGVFLDGIIKSVKANYDNIFFHLDHGKSFETVEKAINMGFDSVMIDGSSLSFEDNVNLTKMVVDFAHKFDVQVEGEMGVLKGIEDEVSSEINIFSDPDQCLEFVKRTNVDSLAVAIGTSHGAYKFNKEAKLNFDLLKKIEDKLGSYPLVLHGASSVYVEDVALFNKNMGALKNAKGVDDSLLIKIAHETNIIKINTDTDLRINFLANLKQSILDNPSEIDMRKHSNYAIEKLSERIIKKIELIK